MVRHAKPQAAQGPEKEAELALSRSAREQQGETSILESLFDIIPDPINIQTPDHRIIRANQAYCDLVQRGTEEIIGRNCFELGSRTLPCESCAAAVALETRKPALVEKHVEEMGKWFECRAYPALGEDGEILRIIEHIQDITARKQAEMDRLRLERRTLQSQKMESLGVLAGGIAHDFNNILMTVMGNAELTRMKLDPLSPVTESLKEITAAVRRASDLCRQMLAYSGKTTFELRPTKMGEVIEEMSHLLKTSISKKAILEVRVADGLPLVDADPDQLRQIVMNLIINASDATGDRPGAITVRVNTTLCDKDYLRTNDLVDLAPGPYVHLEVSDDGCGMDDATKSRIFDPFFSTKFTGRGLGLAAVAGIVKAHRGGMLVQTELGKGTTFKILVPALSSPVSTGEKSFGLLDDEWRGSGTILLVDDEESLRSVGTRLLQDIGFTVLVANDGLECVEIFRERAKDIDLVLLDLTMPRMDGSGAFDELRRIDPKVRVVLTSGYCKQDTQARFAGKGLRGILEKPYTLEDLRAALRFAIEATPQL